MMRVAPWFTAVVALWGHPGMLRAQQDPASTLAVGALNGELRLDGVLDEPDWGGAEAIPAFTQVEPVEGGAAAMRTVVRVLANADALVIGIECYDPDPARIVSFSKARDSELRSEDHVKLLLDTFLAGQSGYLFAVNADGARYDALIANRGEGENPAWDAVWEAATATGAEGWAAEIRIPIRSLEFRAGLVEWGFNVERRVQRLQETSRWVSATRDARVSHPSRAGRLTALPNFSYGAGLSVRPALVSGFERPKPDSTTTATLDPSLDVTQRLGSNVLASLTFNTDFAETDADTRRTNLTRFSLFFPEKRTFFLAGADIFDFGIGLTSGRENDLLPFHTRRIGLLEEAEVPLRAGAKVNGRVGRTSFGALATRTGALDTLAPATWLSAGRLRQNVLEESSVGLIWTAGDPGGRPGSWLGGVDATYQTSRLFGDKNLLVGAWVLVTDRDGLVGDRTAFGVKVDYPNDTWDVSLTYKRLGEGFDPSLGFVPRRGIHKWSSGLNYRFRPPTPWMRWALHELRATLVQTLDGVWESYSVFTAPINWLLESGERFEFNIMPTGERLREAFEIADGVAIDTGAYHWVRYRLEADIATKRPVSGRFTWWFGGFYDGTLHQLQARALIQSSGLVTIEVGAERNIGSLSAGDFTKDLLSARLLVNVSPDLQVIGFVQYDNESGTVGSNARLRWTFHPLGDLFVVYNHNVEDWMDRWRLESNQLLVKLQYAARL